MAIVNQTRSINLIPKMSAPLTIHVSQGDQGSTVELYLLEGDHAFENPGGITATIHGTRADGGNFGPYGTAANVCTLSGNTVTFSLQSEMTAVAGAAIAEVVLVDSTGNKVGSANFAILVEKSAFPEGVTYDNDKSVYEDILAYAQQFGARLDNILASVTVDSEVIDARSGADGVDYTTLGNAIRTQFDNLKYTPLYNASSGDFDDFAESNRPYFIWRGNTYTNRPPIDANFGLLWCFKQSGGTRKIQVFANIYTGKIFMRWYNTSWSVWYTDHSHILDTNTDLDSVTYETVGYLAPDNTYVHAPNPSVNCPALLYVYRANGSIGQVAIYIDTGEMYTRRRIGTSFGEWSSSTKNTLTSSMDLNDLKTPGIYSTLTSSAPSNLPVTSGIAGNLYVSWDKDNTICYQTFVQILTGKVYTRLFIKSSNTWWTWRDADSYTGSIGTHDDFNDFKTKGIYTSTSGLDGANRPCEDQTSGVLFVHSSNSLIYQTFIQTYTGTVYTRLYKVQTDEWVDWASNIKDDITSSMDLNNLKTAGVYSVGTSGTAPSNFPVTSGIAGNLHVTWNKAGTICYQTFIQIATGKVYTRLYIKSSNTWWTWRDADNYAGTVNNSDDFNDIKTKGTYWTGSGLTAENRPCDDQTAGILLVHSNAAGTLVYQTFIQTYTGTVYTRLYKANTDEWVSWTYKKPEVNSIKILFVGNSMTMDAVTWLPLVLTTYFPEINFEFYVWFVGGADLATQYEYFTSDTPSGCFLMAKNSPIWTQYRESKKMSSVLSTYKFDIVCMQEYFNDYAEKPNYNVIENWNNCKNYIQSHYTGGNGLEFISLFHAPQAADRENVYAKIKAGNEQLLQETITQDMIPAGIAQYNALSTAIGTLGYRGNLTTDNLHAQEGLPNLIQVYTLVCWILDKLSINKSIYGLPFRATQEIFVQYFFFDTPNQIVGVNIVRNVEGGGLITGTDAQNLIAQEVAIMAYKEGKAFVNAAISGQ